MTSIDDVQDISPRVQYTASAAQTEFDYTFPIFEDADIVVDIDGVTQTLTTDYTVTGEGNDTGGTVTLVVAAIGGEVVTIYRDIAIARNTDVQQNGPWSSTSYNDEMDKVFLIMQELENKIGRAIRFPLTAAISNTQTLLDPISTYAGKFLRITSAGLLEAATALDNTVALSAQIIGELLNPRTAAEITAGVTIVDYSKPPGNVLRYGTNTTPGTTDMTTAIQAAIDSSDSPYVPCGSYLVTAGLTISSSKHFFGEGYGSQIICNDEDVDVITITASNSSVRDLRITAGGKDLYIPAPETDGYGIHITGGSHATVISHVEISGCYIENGQEDIRASYCDYLRITDNYFSNTNAGWFCVKLWETDYAVVTDNTCIGNNVMANAIGTWGATADTNKARSCIIANNVCRGFLYEAIELMGSYHVIDSNVIYSDSSESTMTGILLHSRGTNDDTTGNVISNNTLVGGKYGIHITEFELTGSYGAKNTVVSGNVLSNIAGIGILVQYLSTGTVITGNTIDGVVATHSTGWGINNQSNQTTIENNVVKNCAADGIFINGARTACSISHNSVSDCDGDGIDVQTAVRTRIIGNDVSDNGGWGINTASTTVTPIIRDNTGSGNSTGLIKAGIPALDNTGTPSVAAGSMFRTGGTTTITDFDDGFAGQEITVFCEHSLTIDVTGTSLAGGTTDITAADGDVMRWVLDHDQTTWRLINYMKQSADQSAGT